MVKTVIISCYLFKGNPYTDRQYRATHKMRSYILWYSYSSTIKTFSGIWFVGKDYYMSCESNRLKHKFCLNSIVKIIKTSLCTFCFYILLTKKNQSTCNNLYNSMFSCLWYVTKGRQWLNNGLVQKSVPYKLFFNLIRFKQCIVPRYTVGLCDDLYI